MFTSKTALFLRHYVEMIIAMFLGMAVLGVGFTAALAPLGVDVGDWRTDAPELMLLGMAFTMSGTLLLIEHVGMFPAMLAVMFLRLDEYTGHAQHALA